MMILLRGVDAEVHAAFERDLTAIANVAEMTARAEQCCWRFTARKGHVTTQHLGLILAWLHCRPEVAIVRMRRGHSFVHPISFDCGTGWSSIAGIGQVEAPVQAQKRRAANDDLFAVDECPNPEDESQEIWVYEQGE
ncbi:hypothetical protein [Inhella gelatinilytica]|uniref:Uncharacterized protein n=1 Tax=Inhella gelatinilytica TaxID=2795030 RepID=A0A931IY12_9BURK|nr:hypothetical protein [Inhella gelatinilytica]MBH9553992.1 hypothetical protein [Inhella gelatinilytica]